MEEEGFHFLNLEYLLLRVYDFFGSFSVGDLWGTLPSWLHFLTTQVAIWGMVITLLFVLLIVYTQIKLLMVEHEGFHGKEEHQVHVEETVAAPPQSERWRRVMELASSGSQSDWRRAILEADIMLAVVLAEAGYEGSSIGDQLKMANPFQMSTLDLAWKAHKVRNQVAHGGETYELTERDTRTAIDQYRRVFEEFGAI
ncbi:MAG: protein of unknown function with transrane region [Candidatus Adlerbacteria bacterium]|nr:protein of unknown function with transrane region [Candidatus Adlerbacteria bacterium]